VWAIAECEWNTGGTSPQDLAAGSLEELVLLFASLEVPRAECVDAWKSISRDHVVEGWTLVV
jgi:hypothetical protein